MIFNHNSADHSGKSFGFKYQRLSTYIGFYIYIYDTITYNNLIWLWNPLEPGSMLFMTVSRGGNGT